MTDLEQAKTIFFHGIGGSGMRGLAWLLHSQGKRILGTDTNLPNDIDPAFKVVPESDATTLLQESDFYIHTDAVPPNHPLYLEAQSQGIPQAPYHFALGQFSQNYTVIAIAGTHGKSSTTAFLSHILITAGLDPTVLVGASIPGWPGKNARAGKTDLFVVEADEYRDHFLSLTPAHAIITNIEYDHPDYFAALSDVEASFQSFINSITQTLTISIAIIEQNRLQIPTKATIVTPSSTVSPPLPGQHMAHNASLAIAAATNFGISPEDAQRHLESFPGLHRRFEHIATIADTEIISDYAHHPREIAVTIDAAQQRYPHKKIGVIFEAHTAERLTVFRQDFAEALKHADAVMLYPPFLPEGRTQTEGLAAFSQLSDSLPEAIALKDKSNFVALFREFIAKCDVVIACTAGNLDRELRTAVKQS